MDFFHRKKHPKFTKSENRIFFIFCWGLTSIDLSGCVTLETIGREAFEHCKNLTRVNLSGCVNLKTIV